VPNKQTKKQQGKSSLTQYLRRPIVQIVLVIAAVLMIVLIFSLTRSGNSNLEAADISVTRAQQLYQQKGVFFLDVREQEEWDSFHIPSTTLIPLGQLESRLSEIPKDQQIVVVCRSGNRSKQGRDILIQAGYTKVTSMTGGVTEWKTQGFPIEP
jgi:rhodanese-related sulfurtransferase